LHGRARNIFDRYEVRAVLVAKLLLGLNASRLSQCVVRRQIDADRIIEIERNGRSLFNPGPDEELQAGDKVLLLGTHSQLAAATPLMEA
jgi:K+/H+ antiporter YhaU regulatory subunit KhtT